MKKILLMITIVLGFLGCVDRREADEIAFPVPAIEEVLPEPATGDAGWAFSGQNAQRWRLVSGQDLLLPEGLLSLDSLWRQVVHQGDSVWVLQQVSTCSDTTLFPPINRDFGSFCADVVEIPLLLFPDVPTPVDTPPVHIRLQARTTRDTVWKTLTRWPWLVVWHPDSFRKCPQEMFVSVGGNAAPVGWGGMSCFGELDPPGQDA